MTNLYLYPPQVPTNRDVIRNPYISNFVKGLSKYFQVVNRNRTAKISILDLYKHLFKIDVVVFNWIENIGNRKAGFFQFLMFLLGFVILKLRNVKVVWILHNIHPHKGESKLSEFVKNIMFRNANLIVTHSKQALKYGKTKTKKKIVFLHHPSNPIDGFDNKIHKEKSVVFFDILIWGSIEPYKGIVEFLEFCKEENLQYRIKIIGRCQNINYLTKMNSYRSGLVDFENKMVSFMELDKLISCSNYVLFPYVSTSVSSSGALFDTLSLYGNIIGPNKGAFSDLEEEKLCYTFSNYNDIIEIIKKKSKITRYLIKEFNSQNTWDSFSERFFKILNNLN